MNSMFVSSLFIFMASMGTKGLGLENHRKEVKPDVFKTDEHIVGVYR